MWSSACEWMAMHCTPISWGATSLPRESVVQLRSEQIVAYLKRNPGARRRQIAEEFVWTEDEASTFLETAKKRGYVRFERKAHTAQWYAA